MTRERNTYINQSYVQHSLPFSLSLYLFLSLALSLSRMLLRSPCMQASTSTHSHSCDTAHAFPRSAHISATQRTYSYIFFFWTTV